MSRGAVEQQKNKLPHPLTTEELAERCSIAIQPGQPFIAVKATAEEEAAARTLVEAFADHVAAAADDWVARRGTEHERQIAAAQGRLQELRVRLNQASASAPKSYTEPKENPALRAEALALQTVQQELAQALTKFTEEHPRVKELRASIAALEQEMARKTPTVASLTSELIAAAPQSALPEVELARLNAEFHALSSYRDHLIQTRVVSSSKDSERWRRADQIGVSRVTEPSRLMTHYAFGALAGLVIGVGAQGMTQRRKRPIHDRQTMEQATQLPVLAVLPELKCMSESAREYWAVETLNVVRSAARADRRGCFVCGVISASNGEGRSTVIDLLANAGLRTGNRVLVVPTPDFSQPGNTFVTPPPSKDSVAVARQALMLEAGPNSLPVHWERAFATWQHEENALVLVELPPATTPDALVFSTGVPNVLWLGAANVADSESTARCVNSLRNSGCHLIGAALNMCSSIQKRAAAWAVLAMLFVSQLAQAQQPTPPVVAETPPTNGISATKAPSLAPWQQKLTVGPGDVLSIGLYGQSDSGRQVIIGPDGRFSFLQATDVEGASKTIDELRAHLEQVLMKYHLAPRVVISPLAFRSKKYYMLGNVAGRGAYSIDRPLTLVEAVARANGFVTGTPGRSSFTLTDFSQAFLMRRQPDGSFAREPVDFESLFQRGELQHNKLLAPDDYVYFPPTDLEQVFVLGEVLGTGPLPYTKELTVMGAIAGRGGFTEAAFREKILVVRGSLTRPETFVVDMGQVLRAAGRDFPLQPKDIVYVSRKPWAKAEEILEAAASDFVRAVVVTWTGEQIGPIGGRDR